METRDFQTAGTEERFRRYEEAAEEVSTDILLEDNSSSRNYRIAAVLITMAGVFASIWFHERGTVVFSLSSSLMMLLSIVDPSKTRIGSRWLFGIMKNLRKVFQSGDRLARYLVVFLAVGGTALICKYGILNFSLLPGYLDVAFKRIGAALLFVSFVFYPASLISKRIYGMSEFDVDPGIRRYELLFYVSCLLYCATIFISFCLFKIEGTETFKSMKADPVNVWGLSADSLIDVWLVALIWVVWCIGFGACILSRFVEQSFKKPVRAAGLAATPRA